MSSFNSRKPSLNKWCNQSMEPRMLINHLSSSIQAPPSIMRSLSSGRILGTGPIEGSTLLTKKRSSYKKKWAIKKWSKNTQKIKAHSIIAEALLSPARWVLKMFWTLEWNLIDKTKVQEIEGKIKIQTILWNHPLVKMFHIIIKRCKFHNQIKLFKVRSKITWWVYHSLNSLKWWEIYLHHTFSFQNNSYK